MTLVRGTLRYARRSRHIRTLIVPAATGVSLQPGVASCLRNRGAGGLGRRRRNHRNDRQGNCRDNAGAQQSAPGNSGNPRRPRRSDRKKSRFFQLIKRQPYHSLIDWRPVVFLQFRGQLDHRSFAVTFLPDERGRLVQTERLVTREVVNQQLAGNLSGNQVVSSRCWEHRYSSLPYRLRINSKSAQILTQNAREN